MCSSRIDITKNYYTLKNDHQSWRKTEYFQGVKELLKRACGRSKPVTPRSASRAYIHQCLKRNMCVLRPANDGSFAIYIPYSGSCKVVYTPCPLSRWPTAKDKSDHGTGSCQAFCVLNHGEEGCGFASFAAITIRIHNHGE